MTRMQQDLLRRTSLAATEYNKLLLRMNQVTDHLLTAIERSNMRAAQNLLQARSDLCSKIDECGQSLGLLVQELYRNDSFDSTNARGLQTILDEAQANLGSLIRKQADSESALAAKIKECCSDLAALRQGRGLRDAYRKAAPEENARFLDSKL